jgi:uncharacterized protein with ParB-like and HNH nuclease domain
MKIETSETNLESFFSGLSTSYRVPSYQRDYSWTEEEIDQLWADLVVAFESRTNYFVGTLVLNSEPGGAAKEDGHFDIVDGQQRLSTLSIIFCIIRNVGKELAINPTFLPEIERTQQFSELAPKICNYAEDRLLYRSEPNNYYLVLNKKDQPIFYKQVQTFSQPQFDLHALRRVKSDSRLIKAKKVLAKKIYDTFLNGKKDVSDLYQFLVYLAKKLQFIRIVVEDDYDAYLLFESLNSKGLDLSTADLVKNKLLSICKNDEAKRERTISSWESIVDKLSGSRFPTPVDFLRFYWLAFRTEKPTKRDLYRVVKKHLQDPSFDVDQFMTSLSESVEHFLYLTDIHRVWPSNTVKNRTKDQYIAELNSLRFAIHIPTFLFAMKMRNDSFLTNLSQKSLSFLVRLLTVGGYAVSIADGVFAKALEKLRQEGPPASDAEVFACFDVEDEKIGDPAFRANFTSFVSHDSQICRYLLAKIHAHSVGDEQIPKTDEIHLEHILPQDSSVWESAGFDYAGKPIDDLKYSIGNMTLLNKSLNAAISNRVFSEKVSSYRKKTAADQSGTTFPMTYEIHEAYAGRGNLWTRDVIEKRAEKWASMVAVIWPR